MYRSFKENANQPKVLVRGKRAFDEMCRDYPDLSLSKIGITLFLILRVVWKCAHWGYSEG
jgi:hypothetical protein